MKSTREQQRNALKCILFAVGGQAALARLLSTSKLTVKPQNVQFWLKTGKIPAEHVLRIEHYTGVSRYELRPDVFCFPEDLALT